MWNLIDRKMQLTIIMVLTVVTLLGLQSLAEIATGSRYSFFRLLSAATFLIGTVLVIIFNSTWRWIWKKLPIMNKLFFPDLNGKWEGALVSTWVNPETGKSPDPIQSHLEIIQSLFDICVKMKTGESRSYSTRVIAEAEPKADRYRLWYSYSNRPKAEVSHRSAQHDGAAWLEVHLGDDPNELHGQYFTSRRTNGDMEFRRASVDTSQRA